MVATLYNSRVCKSGAKYWKLKNNVLGTKQTATVKVNSVTITKPLDFLGFNVLACSLEGPVVIAL